MQSSQKPKQPLQALVNFSPERTFVRWYRDSTSAGALFQNAVDSANGKESVAIFEFHAPDGLSPSEITALAEKIAKSGNYVALCTHQAN